MREHFISKSADPEYVRKKNLHRSGKNEPIGQIMMEKVKPSRKEDIIFYIGSFEDDFLSYGKELGFILIPYNTQDPSVLLSGSYLLLSDLDMDLRRRIETLNIASCYGLKIIWQSKKSIPHRFMWRFKLCMVGDISKEKFWEEVWNLSL